MFPPGASTITLTGTLTVPVGGTASKGQIVLTPSARLVDATNNQIYSGGGPVTLDANGAFSTTLLRTDSAGVAPAGWKWRVDEQPNGGPRATYWIELTAAMGATVDLSDVAAVSAPDGGSLGAPPSGVAGGDLSGSYPNPSLSSATIALFDPAGAAASAQSAAISAAAADATAKVAAHEADTSAVHGIADTTALETTAGATAKVTAHTTASDPHGDRAYADGQHVPQAQIIIDQLFANDPFYIAHRGGGASAPEHTLAAWDSAVAAGALAIEVSCHISADGVLFCMHDTTLDRVTNGTWTGAHSTWTWAQLQQKAKVVSTALLGPGWADQPIPTVREILDRYLGKVVIFLEAKANGAVVPLQTMLGTYKGANKSVVWKNYYQSNSFPWAKANGYKVWAYMDATTTSAQLDAVEANVDYWGIPIDAADAQFQMVLTRPTFKPVITWPVWRRSERDRVVGFNYGGKHVQGIMCSEFLYVPRSTAIETSSSFSRGIRAPGQIGAAKEDAAYALKFDTANSAVYAPATSGNGVLMGNFCPVPQGATGYKIQFDMMFPQLPSGTLHAGLAFCKASDDKYQFGVGNATGGYHFLFRPNAGDMQLYRHDPGVASGTQLDTVTTGAVTAGQWASFEIEVNATQVILRRTDVGPTVRTINNTAYRGQYFHIHNGSLTDTATLPRFRNLKTLTV